MNRPNDLFRNLLLTPLCFLVVFGGYMLMNTTLVSPNDPEWYLVIGLALVVGMLIALIVGIRLLVTCVVTIYSLIHYPLWKSENEKWALWAVSRVRSDSKLAEIAQDSASLNVALYAVKRLRDTALLKEIAKNDSLYASIRETACEKIKHDWNHCTCKRCGKKRDGQHDWDGCRCRQCGNLRHNFDDDNVCTICKARLVTEIEYVESYTSCTGCPAGSGYGCTGSTSTCIASDDYRTVEPVETTYIVFSDGTKQRWR